MINEGLIDYKESKIHGRQNIYYPLVTGSFSIESIMGPIDKESQHSSTIYEKITTNITEGWIVHGIIRLIRYRLDHGTTGFIEYVNDSQNIQILDNKSMLEQEEG